MHVPPVHKSLVQKMPSSAQGVRSKAAGCVQPPPLQTSWVHGLPSSRHFFSVPKFWCVQLPLSHKSAVHSLASSAQGTVNATAGCKHAPFWQ